MPQNRSCVRFSSSDCLFSGDLELVLLPKGYFGRKTSLRETKNRTQVRFCGKFRRFFYHNPVLNNRIAPSILSTWASPGGFFRRTVKIPGQARNDEPGQNGDGPFLSRATPHDKNSRQICHKIEVVYGFPLQIACFQVIWSSVLLPKGYFGRKTSLRETKNRTQVRFCGKIRRFFYHTRFLDERDGAILSTRPVAVQSRWVKRAGSPVVSTSCSWSSNSGIGSFCGQRSTHSPQSTHWSAPKPWVTSELL